MIFRNFVQKIHSEPQNLEHIFNIQLESTRFCPSRVVKEDKLVETENLQWFKNRQTYSTLSNISVG